MYEITNDELRQLQLKNLELLIYFKNFCIKHNLEFFLCGGSCLGAVRHRGFIPWDDDVDILMRREAYERLGRLWNAYADADKYSYIRPDNVTINQNKYVTISDNETTLIQMGKEKLDINHGVALEILPLDGYPSSFIKRRIQIFWAIIYSLYCNQIAPIKHGIIVEKICELLLKIVSSPKLKCKIWKHAEEKMSSYKINDNSYITALCTFVNIDHKYPKSMFDKVLWVDFEDEKMPIPIGYDEYLKILYGNYMELPPVEKQVHKHPYIFFDLQNSYKKYRGIYYLAKNN